MQLNVKMHILVQTAFVLLCVSGSRSQLADNWWDQLTTTAAASVAGNLVGSPDSKGQADTNACCECVPFYLCGENNTIIEDGGGILGPRIGTNKVTDVETCPDVTQLCCRLPVASPTCHVDLNIIVSRPDTPCECINWDLCGEEFRISDGTISSTFIEGKPLQAHAKCTHKLEVCCAILPDDGNTTVSISTPSSVAQCACVNPWMCGPDGNIITDGGGDLDLRNSPPSKNGNCVAPRVCCRMPIDNPRRVTSAGVAGVTVVTPILPVIKDTRCSGIRNFNGIAVSIYQIIIYILIQVDCFTIM